MKKTSVLSTTSSSLLPLHELRIELLKECPLQCLHCSAFAAPHHPLRLPLSRVMTLLDEFAALGGQQVTFTGGEPLEYGHLDTVLAKAKRLQLHTRLFSAGIVFDNEQRVSAIRQLDTITPDLDMVIFSLYGAQPITHDAVTTCPGSFALTLAAISYACKQGIKVGIHFVPTQTNYREFSDLVALASTVGVNFMSVLRFVAHGRGRANADTLALDHSSHVWLRREIEQVPLHYPNIQIKLGSAYNLLGVGTPAPCTAGIDQLVIEANGHVSPCIAFVGHHVSDLYGNILRDSLSTVWERSSYLQQTRATLAVTNRYQGCLAQKVMITGNIDNTVIDPLEMLTSNMFSLQEAHV